MPLPHQILKREPWGIPIYWTLSTVGWFGYTAATIVSGLVLAVVFSMIAVLLAPSVVPFFRGVPLLRPLLRLYELPFIWAAEQITQLVSIAAGLSDYDPHTKKWTKIRPVQLPGALLVAGLFKILPNPWTFYSSFPMAALAVYGVFLVRTNPEFFAAPQVPAPGEAISQAEKRELEKNQKLRPGTYKSAAGILVIHQDGRNFCVQLQNEYGTAINSVLPEQPEKGFYLVHEFELVSLVQQDKNTLVWYDDTEGTTDYTLADQKPDIAAELETPISDCLNSAEPFAYYADPVTDAVAPDAEASQTSDVLPLEPGIYAGETTESYILAQRDGRYCMSYSPDEVSPVSIFSLASEPDEDGSYRADYGNGVFFSQVDASTLRYTDRATTTDAYLIEGFSVEEVIEQDPVMQECLASDGAYSN
jgi:hypothetical protein